MDRVRTIFYTVTAICASSAAGAGEAFPVDMPGPGLGIETASFAPSGLTIDASGNFDSEIPDADDESFGSSAMPAGAGILPTAFERSGFQPPPAPPPAPAAELPPIPSTGSSSAAGSSLGTAPNTASTGNKLYEMAPWNPSPPKGVTLTPPGAEYPTVKITGFFQADTLWFNQDEESIRTVGDAPDGAGFRRARLAAKGSVFENVDYMIEMDFATPGRPSFMDVYLDLKEMPYVPGTIRIGQWRMPFGMDALTSVRELQFIERALPFAFVPFRQIGVGLLDPVGDDETTWAVSAYRYPTDVYGNNVGDGGGYSMATRETIVFGGERDDDPLLHIGGDYSFTSSSFDTFRFQSQPEVSISEVAGPVTPPNVPLNTPPFVDTGLLTAEYMNLFGAELGGRAGCWHAQGEAYCVNLNRVTADNNFFWGAYGQIGYILTGEVLPYNKANGVFSRVLPKDPLKKGGGWGAWELVGRWSMIDLNDADVDGGNLTDFTAGLNWYLNPRTKFQLNYIHSFLNRVPSDAPGTPALDSEANVIAARAQVDF